MLKLEKVNIKFNVGYPFIISVLDRNVWLHAMKRQTTSDYLNKWKNDNIVNALGWGSYVWIISDANAKLESRDFFL